jgi:hypothetical protein
MKKLYVVLVAVLFCNAAMAQIAFEENFSAGTMPAGFTLHNDANIVAPNIAQIFPDAWVVRPEPADTTNMVAASPSWFTDPTAQADRWMVTPAIAIGPGMALAWRGKAQDASYMDGYAVKISTTGTAKADFTIDVVSLPAETSTWTSRHFDLSAYNGQTIHVAFIQNSTDMFYIMIDDIKVGVLTGIEEAAAAVTTVRLSPNPATDYLNVHSSAMIQTLKVINAVGQIVIEETVNANHAAISVSHLQAGIYFVVGTTADGSTFNEKVIVR